MSLDPGIDAQRTDGDRLAAAARSILACPAEVELVVDGIDDLGAEIDDLEMREDAGRPSFSCATDAALAVAATDRRGALVTLRSGLGRPGSPDRDAVLTLSGRLSATGMAPCECCSEVRMQVGLDLDFALLSRVSVASTPARPDRFRVPLAAFHSPAHDLNRGFLQRSVEHANSCHATELRHAVATRTATRPGEIVGVQVRALRPDAVVLQWVDGDGGHQSVLSFPRAARSRADLGDLLRDQLHAGMC